MYTVIYILEPLRIPEDYHTNSIRRRRSDEKDGLALSREIFRNITKKLRENIKREGATDVNDHLLQSEYRFQLLCTLMYEY